MGAYDHWCAQKQKLLLRTQNSENTADLVYALRHTLAQVEQNVMAEQTDDLLRQQIGILFSCCKTSVNLLDVSITAKVWVAQPLEKPKGKKKTLLWVLALLLQAAAGVCCYLAGQWIVWLLLAGALGLSIAALAGEGRQEKNDTPDAETKVTLRPDAEKLMAAIDVQLRAVDRYMNDFMYLNEQMKSTNDKGPDEQMIALAANMLEALYEQDDEVRKETVCATGHMMRSIGVDIVEYSQAECGLFTTLPSKNETRTMIPAMVAAGDKQLIRRGMAAVKADGE